MTEFAVVVSAGSFQRDSPGAVRFPHRWTEQGVTVEADFTGAHLLHLSAAGCVLNDLYREASGLKIPIAGVRVTAHGDFDRGTWESTGITYRVELDSSATAAELAVLLARVDEIAEIPRAIRAGAPVSREASNAASNGGAL
ncbi:OsmC family protein [Actinoplanes sp. NPDC023714]|uniref:OsmC family protein n=1 Tax=Actinoplanes sp. NPDC023714 TaxID=3154322 RepID=UPI0033EDF03B